MKMLKWNGILFDYYSKWDGLDGKGQFYWSQVSKEDVQKYGINDLYLDEAGQGMCGIKGHNEESDYYIDFPLNEIELVEVMEDLKND